MEPESESPMILRHLTPLPIIAVAALLAACSDDALEPGSTSVNGPAETIDVEITIEDFSFDPTVINIDLGDEIAAELANDGEQTHTFTVNEFLVDEELTSGQDADVSFTPNEPGEFTYFCRIHPDEMRGTLRVTGPGGSTDDQSGDGGGSGAGY